MSSASVAEPPATTVAQFDEFLLSQPDGRLWELVDGRIEMMTNPSENHEQVASNLGAALKISMDRRGCRTYQGGMRIQRSDDVGDMFKARPDVLVRCGSPSNNLYVTDPVVVAEVLSPSTMRLDRRGKLDFYQSLPTVMHIVHAYQDSVRVEHYYRLDGEWEVEVLTSMTDELCLASVDFRITLSAIYFDIAFEQKGRARGK